MELRPSHGRAKRPHGSDEGDIDPVDRHSPRPQTAQTVSGGSGEVSSPVDSRMQLEFAIEEDIPAELEDFVRLSRLGLFKDALEMFDQTLRDHANLFPVAAEYADGLLEQGSYGKLKEFVLKAERSTWEDDENDVFELLLAFSNIKINGELHGALVVARKWYDKQTKPPEQFSEAEIQSLELYLHIIVMVYDNSNWLQEKDTHPPCISVKFLSPWEGYRRWCKRLIQDHRPWEAQRILRLLLKVTLSPSAVSMYEEFLRGLNDLEPSDPLHIARISAINAYLKRLLDDPTAHDLVFGISSRTVANLNQMAREELESLKLLSMDSRPYLEQRINSIRTNSFMKTDIPDEIFISAERHDDYMSQLEVLLLSCQDPQPIRSHPKLLTKLLLKDMKDNATFSEFVFEKKRHQMLPLPYDFKTPVVGLGEDILSIRITVPRTNQLEAEAKIRVAQKNNDPERLDLAERLLRESEKHLPARTFKPTVVSSLDIHHAIPPLEANDLGSQPHGMIVLLEPPKPEVDIVLVHGLEGHPYATWSHTSSGTFWPKDFLAVDIPYARVLSYGYDAAFTKLFQPSPIEAFRLQGEILLQSLVAEVTKVGRPIFFIAHNFGGFICQQALFCALKSVNSAERRILDLTDAITFMAMPFESGSRTWAGAVYDAYYKILPSPRSINRPLLSNSSQQFIQMEFEFDTVIRTRQRSANGIQVACFYEENGQNALGRFTGSSPITWNHSNVPVSAELMDMTKFASRDDPSYREIVRFLVRIHAQTWAKSISRGVSRPQSANIPNKKYVTDDDAPPDPQIS